MGPSLSHAWVRAVWARCCHGYAGLASATLRAETPRMTGERSVDVAAAAGTLQVALLGGFSVRVGSRAVPGSWRLRKSKTLVKLLALAEGHRAHRDVLAGCSGPGWTLPPRRTICTRLCMRRGERWHRIVRLQLTRSVCGTTS